jgi:hypothetical protein
MRLAQDSPSFSANLSKSIIPPPPKGLALGYLIFKTFESEIPEVRCKMRQLIQEVLKDYPRIRTRGLEQRVLDALDQAFEVEVSKGALPDDAHATSDAVAVLMAASDIAAALANSASSDHRRIALGIMHQSLLGRRSLDDEDDEDDV